MSIPIPHRQLFIDGEWREPVNRKLIPITNPATEEIIGDIPAATAEDVNIAVEAARRALSRNGGKDWASATGAHRAKYLRAIAAKITERKSELAELEAVDCGKPLEEAAWDIDDVAGCFEYYADIAGALDKKQKIPVSLPMDTFKCHVIGEPIGVVGLITPWNYPMLMATWKVAPALAAGYTAILKPSELASVTCLELADVCREVGLQLRQWRKEWIKQTNKWQSSHDVFPTVSSGDPLNISRWLYDKYLNDPDSVDRSD